ncbi:unnamed protein product [Schistosoma margrebowiei]|uniref:Uncharacterized protein n=1 Tax=Schistosoma margrebowiei TaxID=48269 RepID=A0A183MAT9_9TREM|nr:unnamed protein product [Schistosoma margrebowiei]
MESSRPKEERKTKEHITPGNGNRHEKDEQELDGIRKGGRGQSGLENAGRRPMLHWEERVRQYYQALLNRLDEVKRNEASLRRSQLYSETVKSSHVPGGGSFNDAVVNRRMEKVFEAELLYQLSNVNREEYIDVNEENTLENDNNNNDINGYNEVLDMESKQKSLSATDVKLTNDSNLVEQPMLLSNYRVLEFGR